MDDFLERWRVPVILILLVMIGAGLVALLIRWRPVSPMMRSSPPAAVVSLRTVEPRQIKVHVTGAVAWPGVYTFREGDRVEDALKAAGGATAEADVGRLNLAQRLHDEDRLVVPGRDDTPIPAGTGGYVASAGRQGKKVNINTASQGELEALPGIGATYAQRIVESRAKTGPYEKTTDLVTRKLIPQSTFDKIKDLIDVR